MKTYEYKDEIIRKLKDYNPIINNDNDSCIIEIKNNNNSLSIELNDEITISFGDWHCHYNYEDRDDYEMVMEKVNNIINNRDCYYSIYSNNKLYLCGSALDKDMYSKEEILDIINKFIGNNINGNSITVKINYWDETKNYEIII